jgi:glycine/D-amino acid oxidase-like deaminating enzyme
MENSPEYTIVGGGLAGMLIAWELVQRGKKIEIYANNAPASSSVAAGTWNPVTFRRMIPTWRAQEMIDAMLCVYPKVEKKLGIKVLSMIKVEKILANEQESDFWKEMAQKEEVKDFLEPQPHELTINGSPKLAGIVKQTGRLDLPLYVSKLHEFFEENSSLKRENFNYDSINSNHKYIFTEGTYCEQNPYFNWLPFRCVKGDILTIKSTDLKVDKIRKKNIFILPLGKDTYKIGATYDWQDKTWGPSEKGKAEILEKFEKISNCAYKVVGHESGIRPATHDRRPFIGTHPKYKNLFIFNGLGSKGVFLGPLLAKEFCDSLENKGEIHQEVSINRCFKKYYKEV